MLSHEILALWTPSGWELIIIAIIALLLFGKRLPEVARSMGKGVVEFKKGLKGVEDEVDKVQDDVRQAEYEEPRRKDYSTSETTKD